jgi:4-amino-4-deoxy-L-arabinose transferase-like glycosyltransferase
MFKRLVIVLLIVVHVIFLALLSFKDSPTNIEIAHLPSGLSHWEHGTFYYFKQNPPLVRLIASLPVSFMPHETNWQAFSEDKRLRCELAVGSDFLEANQGKIPLLYGLARLACIPFSILGALICYFWAKELWGDAAGFIAALLWCFSPMILGHGHLLNPDVAAAAMGVTAIYTFRAWLKKKTIEKAIIAGVVCGFCILTKLTWIFLFVLLPFLYIINKVFRLQKENQCSLKKEWLHLGIILLIAVFLINLVYGFEGSFRPLGQYQFVSQSLSGNPPSTSGVLKLGNRFSNNVLGYWPVPFPGYFIEGLDVQKSDFERPWGSYLNGEWKKGGWRSYYFYGMLYKTPETILLLFLTAVFLLLFYSKYRLSLNESILLILPCIFIISLCSLQSNMSVHYRYVIPAFPFIYIFTSRIGLLFQGNSLLPKIMISSLCCGSILITLLYYPYFISYFNFIAGGFQNGYKKMQASSLDWGQDLYHLKEWQKKHDISEPFFLALYSYVKPERLGLKGEPIVQLVHQTEDFDPQHLESGWFAVSRCYTYGNELNFSFFEILKPVAIIGNTIDIFHLSENDLFWFKKQSHIYNKLLTNLTRNEKINKEIKVAVYEHDEYDTNNINRITDILNHNSGFQTSLLNAEEIRQGKLSGFDVVLFPGGSGTVTKKLLGHEGLNQVIQFVQSGGGYVGICGGAYLASEGYGLEFIDTKASLEDVVENGTAVSMADRGIGFVKMKMNRIGCNLFKNIPKHSQILCRMWECFSWDLYVSNDIYSSCTSLRSPAIFLVC